MVAVNGITVPHATVGETQTPKCGAADVAVAPGPMEENEATERVTPTSLKVVERVAVTPFAAASPMLRRSKETSASSPASRIPFPPPPPPPVHVSDTTALEA